MLDSGDNRLLESAQDGPNEDLLVRVERQASGFGGMFLDQDGSLAVYLLDPAQLPRARSAIEAVFGPEHVPAAGMRALQGQYTVSQLKQWFDQMNLLFETPGVAMLDLDEAKNRVTVGIEDGSRTMSVEQMITRLGVPREAVVIQITGEIRPLGTR